MFQTHETGSIDQDFNYTFTGDAVINDIAVDAAGNIIGVGSVGTTPEGYIAKLDPTNQTNHLVAETTIAGTAGVFHDVIETSQGNSKYIVAGQIGGKAAAVAFAEDLTHNNTALVGGTGDDVIYSIIEDDRFEYIAVGKSDSTDEDIKADPGSGYNGLVLKFRNFR